MSYLFTLEIGGFQMGSFAAVERGTAGRFVLKGFRGTWAERALPKSGQIVLRKDGRAVARWRFWNGTPVAGGTDELVLAVQCIDRVRGRDRAHATARDLSTRSR